MSKFKGANWKKKLLSVGLAAGMVVSMLATADLGSIVNAAGTERSDTVLFGEQGVPMRTRTVLNDLPIPEDQRTGDAYDEWLADWQGKTRGSYERPFVVLELVPYYEQASFGYLIEGCEPFAFEKMAGNEYLMNILGGLGGSYCDFETITDETYFFADEMEGKREFYKKEEAGAATDKFDATTWGSYKETSYTDPEDSTKHAILGYYEVVPEGEGNFRFETDFDGKKHIVVADNNVETKKGTLSWHTLNKYVKDEWDELGYSLTEYMPIETMNTSGLADQVDNFISMMKLDQVGSRYLTRRNVTSTDPLYKIPANSLKFYRSNDVFVRDTLGIGKKDAQTYSVAYKAITPYELSQNPQWADIADLLYVSRENKDGAFVTKIYPNAAAYERLGRSYLASALSAENSNFSGNYTASDYAGYADKSRDISAEVALKLFNRVAASKNYIGIVWDSTWHDKMSSDDRNQSNAHYVYDLDDNRLKDTNGNEMQQSGPGDSFRNNIGKLFVMCQSVKPSLTKRFFVDSDKIAIQDGYLVLSDKAKNRTEGERMYWHSLTFYIGGTQFATQNGSGYTSISLNNVDSTDSQGNPIYGDASKVSGYWEAYNGYLNYMDNPIFVQGHCYNYNGNTAIFRGFESTEVGANTVKYKDFDDYIKTNARTKEIWEDLKSKGIYTGNYSSKNGSNIAPWAAIRYILDLDTDHYYDDYEEFRVLDIEPSVALGAGSLPVWELTANDVVLLAPSIPAEATINIDHMIMDKFVGKNEDLNGTYDLIYLGDDAGGFWTGEETRDTSFHGTTNWKDGYLVGQNRTSFVDDSMDGLVYFHLGDKLRVKDAFKGHAQFIFNEAAGYEAKTDGSNVVQTGNWVRQPGNDLSQLKKKELISYIEAGFPVAAAKNLYDTSDHPYVDTSSDCVIRQFLTGYRAGVDTDGREKNGVYLSTEVSKIDARVRARKQEKMVFLVTPEIYTYNNSLPEGTAAQRRAKDATKVYVPKEGSYGVLNFSVHAPNLTDYSVRVFLDQDRNGKFTASSDPAKDEVVSQRPITNNVESFKVYVTDGWVGFIQWKVEIYKTSNPDIRVSREGCSAIRADGEGAKNKILALQIIPNNGTDVSLRTHEKNLKDNGDKNPANNSAWTKLYEQCTDFDIEVIQITFNEFESLFKDASGNSYGFHYDMGRDINLTEGALNNNPNLDIVNKIESQEDHPDYIRNLLGGHTLSEFNMIVLGFKDMYGNTDISNQYGCAEYLFYFADKGHSVLYTHDNSIHYNDTTYTDWKNKNIYGYIANSFLRDMMGMNRYGMVSANLINDTSVAHNLNVDGNATLAKNLKAYNAKKGISFDSNSTIYKQGYTYWCLCGKICQDGMSNNANREHRAQYKWMMVNPENHNTRYYTWQGGTVSRNMETDRAVRLNQGQITQYPFNIPEVLTVASTHGQYYQLNMEDPELTVWYTLEDSHIYGGNDGRNGSSPFGLIYGCTPGNASNNYYIYSKGNIFYSGVGHRAISSDDERKLFVNTLIAAYRPSFEKPEIIVTNSEAVKTARRQYLLRVDQEFDYSATNDLLPGEIMGGNEMAITFIPRDYSGCPTVKCAIYYEGGAKFFGTESSTDPKTSSIYAVNNIDGVKSRGARVTATATESGMENYYILSTEQEYMIVFPKDNLTKAEAWNHIVFNVQNDKILGEAAVTDLYIKPRPLFILD